MSRMKQFPDENVYTAQISQIPTKAELHERRKKAEAIFFAFKCKVWYFNPFAEALVFWSNDQVVPFLCERNLSMPP